MIAATKESFARALEALVRKFEADRDTYLSSGYGEAQARSHFITPLFKALGWDVENEAGVPYHLCEVWEEKGETEGRPDYTFRIHGQTKFFVEAKAPSVPLSNVAHLLQTKRYAWNSRDIFFAGLTDFEEFLFFDASLEPDEKRPRDGEAFHLQCTEYLDKLDLLWELSRDRVAAGSLGQFLRRDRKSIRYRIPVDKRFLDELTEWRLDLARSMHSRNQGLEPRLLNEVVQRLLDRIVFLRIAEDRKVIESRQLWDIADLWEESGGRRAIMEFLVDLFATINNDFNGEIFKPHPCEQVTVESHVLARMIRRLYPPRSPYRFDVIGVELLGSIYERYLGNTLHVTAKQVRIEPKPEVRKAGGVYYTPKFIVDYIVKNTVGKLVEGQTPQEVQKLRILDPACGSGSFLIGAFQYLIDWHLNYYREHPREARIHPMYPEVVKDPDGNLRLSFHAKTRIMRHNLYGVDLDPQAVEITMMSLYLKALEGEREMLAPKQSVLPELKFNIRCGNSLIGSDIEKDRSLTLEERERIRPFDWQSKEDGFGDLLAAGGFDAVIGNPPYVSFGLRGVSKAEGAWGEYLRSQYPGSAEYKLSMYAVFVDQGIQLLSRFGRFGFILPDSFLMGRYFSKLRTTILSKTRIVEILLFEKDFWKAGTVGRPVILTLQSEHLPTSRANNSVLVRLGKPYGNNGQVLSRGTSYSQNYFQTLRHKRFRLFFDDKSFFLVQKIDKDCTPLGKIVAFASGLIGRQGQDSITASRKISRVWMPGLHSGSEIRPYEIAWAGGYICFDHKKLKSGFRDANYVGPKLLLRQTGDSLVAAFDDKGFLCLNNVHVGNASEKSYDLRYILALLNSKLLNWYYRKISLEEGRALAQIDIETVEDLPIKSASAKAHMKIASLVDTRRSLRMTSEPKESLEARKLQGKIDELVYDLYGITAADRKIIEESVPS